MATDADNFLDVALGSGATPDGIPAIEVIDDESPLAQAGGDDGATPSFDSAPADDGEDAGSLRYSDRFVRTLSRAIVDNDTDARAQLEATREGRRALRDIQAAAIKKAESDAKAWTEYDKLAVLEKEDAYTFGQWMADERWRTFYSQMAKQAEGRNKTVASSETPAERLYDRMRSSKESQVLTNEDWAALNPDSFTGDDGAIAFAEAYALRVAQRTAERVSAPASQRAQELRQQTQAVRSAAQFAPPSVQGSAPQRMTARELEAAWIEGVETGNRRPEIEAAYERMRASRSDASWLP